ncbi:unnamed protein product, partial [marine sediment metagenome]
MNPEKLKEIIGYAEIGMQWAKEYGLWALLIIFGGWYGLKW